MKPFEFEIHSLRDFPEFADACSAWAYGEWTSQSRARQLTDVIADYGHRASTTELPQTWIAVSGDKPIGMVTFKMSGEHPDITDDRPWLSSLFTHPHFRGRGVAAELIARCEREAKETYKCSVLHLFTPLEAFYNKLGWQKIDTVRDPMGLHPDGEALMKKDLV